MKAIPLLGLFLLLTLLAHINQKTHEIEGISLSQYNELVQRSFVVATFDDPCIQESKRKWLWLTNKKNFLQRRELI